MKKLFFLILVLTFIPCNVWADNPYVFDVTVSIRMPEDEFVGVSGNRLVLKDSQKNFYFSSTNQYYLFYKPVAMVDEVLQDAKAMGITVIRTWGFCDGMYKEGVSFQPEPGVYSETGFERMDYIIKKAKDLGLRLIIPLVNNWDDFGGMNAYVNWSPTAATHDEFYTDTYCKALYKDYTEHFLNRVNTLTGIRYKDDPTILMWELANEPRCQSDTSGNTLQAWIDEMAEFIKNIDNNHLVSTGAEGWYNKGGGDWRYNGSQGVDYIRNHQSSNIDVCSFHLLKDDVGFSDSEALQWIKEHTDDAHFIIGKPVYCGEFGVKVFRDASDASQQMARRNRLYSEWHQWFLNRVIDGAGFWILSGDSYPDYDHYTVYYPGDAETCSIISSFSDKMAQKRDLNYFPPILLSLQDKEVNEGLALEFQLTVSNPSDLDLTFYATNLPVGANIDNHGYFSWPSPQAGVYNNMEVSVTYGNSISSSKMKITVIDVNGDNTPHISDIADIVMDKNTTLDNAVDLWAITTDDETPVNEIIYAVTSTNPNSGVTLDNNRYIDINPAQDYAGVDTINITATDQRGLKAIKNILLIIKSNGLIRVPLDYPTITQALSNSLYGDMVLVDRGTYNETVTMRDGVNLIGHQGAKDTIINGGLIISNSADDNTVISGFTITNPNGYGISGIDQYASIGSPVIKNSIIKGNLIRGINIYNSSPKIYNNVIKGNSGGGIYSDYGRAEIINNIILDNEAQRGGGIYILRSNGKIFNNIIIDNHATEYGGGIKGWELGPEFEIGYNDVWNNTTGTGSEQNYGTCPIGEGAISEDPLFSNEEYYLASGSPCIDSGHPDSRYNDKDGTRNDMGIYGGSYSLSVANRPPTLNPIGNKKTKEGSLLEFTVSATDPDGDPLEYSALNLPEGAAFNSATRIFTWTPTHQQIGPHPNIIFSVTDSNMSDSEQITITVTPNQSPSLGTLSPYFGSSQANTPVTFTTTYLDPNGWPDIKYARLLVNTSTNAKNCFYGRYDQNANKLYLRNDANTAWLGGYEPGSANIIENSYCLLDCSQTTVSGLGNELKVKWSVTFKPAFAKAQVNNTYMFVLDDSNVKSGWVLKGTWLVGDNSAPSAVSISPSFGGGPVDTARNFTTVYSDPNGYRDLKGAHLLIDTTLDKKNCFYAYYNQNTRKLYLRNDANTAWLGGFVPGSANVIENSYARLDCAKTRVSGLGNNLTVKWNITFKPAFATTKTKNLYLYATDDSNANSGWAAKGTWLVGPNSAPKLGGITPSSGSSKPGQQVNFTTTYIDPNGYADLKETKFLVNTSTSSKNCASLYYDQNANNLYLRNDTNTAWLGGFAPGSAKIIANSFVKLDCSKTTATGSGNKLTVKWTVIFKPTFTGAKNTYLCAKDDSNAASGWVKKGTWTINP